MPKTAKKKIISAAKRETLTPRLRKLPWRKRRQAVKKSVQNKPLITSIQLTKHSLKFMWTHWQILGAIMLVYLILNIIFASGIGNLSNTIGDIKDNLNAAGGHKFLAAIGGFGGLIGTGGAISSQTGSTLQTFLIILESLVIIWALRQLMAKKPFGVKQAYYSATGQLVPFLLVIAFYFIQLLPITLGGAVLSFALNSTLLNTGILTVIFGILFVGLAAWSVYMLSGTIFAMYIITLPEMTPLKALRSAKNLVNFRRAKVIRRLLFLPLFILVAYGVIVIPLILFASFLVLPVFYALSVLALLLMHTYLYSLYRELLE